MKFAEALSAKKPILRLGRFRLRFDTHVLVAEYVPPLDWLRFAPELALCAFVAFAVLTLVLVATPDPGVELAAAPVALLAVAAALVALRLEIHKRRRRAFIFNYATRTLRLDDTTRFWGATRTQLIPFSEIVEAGVTRDETGRYALEVELARRDDRSPPRVEVLVSGVAEEQVEDLFRVAEMARAAFGLTPPPPPAA